jgi:hypothetical protein
MKIIKDRNEYLQNLKNFLPPKPKCMEIGVEKGEFSKIIFENLSPIKLYLVDPFENTVDPITNVEFYTNLPWATKQKTVYSDQTCYDIVSKLFDKEIKDDVVIIDRNLSTNAIQNYEDETFDFIYIDACHLYESVLWDMENYFPKLKKGGILGGHDYFDCPGFGVIRAVDEFCLKYGYEITFLVESSQSGDWLLSPKR